MKAEQQVAADVAALRNAAEPDRWANVLDAARAGGVIQPQSTGHRPYFSRQSIRSKKAIFNRRTDFAGFDGKSDREHRGFHSFNGIVTFQSGVPIIINQGANTVGLFNPTQRPTWNGSNANREGSKAEKIAQWFNRSAFSITPAFTFGNAPRVMPNLRMDGTKNFDLSLFKNMYFNEGKWNVQFRAEFFNAFNRVQFSGPNGTVDNAAFGTVTSQGNGPRQIQLALKLIF